MNIKKSDFTIVAKGLTNELIDDIRGDNEEWLFGKVPSENIMIGMIGAGKTEAPIIRGEEVDNINLKTIPSIGLRYRVDKEFNKVNVALKGKLFYRTRPTFNDQVKYLLEKYSKKETSRFETLEQLKSYLSERKKDPDYIEPKDGIVPVYKSVSLKELGSFELQICDGENSNIDSVNDAIHNRLDNLIDTIRDKSVGYKNVARDISQLIDEEQFSVIRDSSETNVFPSWDIGLYCSVTDYEKYYEVVLQLINNTNEMVLGGTYETSIFNGGLILSNANGFIPFDFNALKYHYTDKPRIPAVGNNCSIVENGNSLETENIPRYEQKRVVTIDKYNGFIEFGKLIDSPVSNLEQIYMAMAKQLKRYEEELQKAKENQSEEYCDSFAKEINDFSCEVKRFFYGIELIKNKSDVRLAFELMNKTFSLGKYKGWRLFQIVFVVSEIADIINSEYEGTPGFVCNDINGVDLIYFSTGGGKTETFLGCVVFAAFFDRIRGKENGATAIIKYPLRLLAAQQLDRVLVLTINANIVKKENSIGGDDFSVGFYTGGKNTPNRIDEGKRQEIESTDQDDLNNLYRQIDYCPLCKKEMNIVFDSEQWKLKHICSNAECGFIPPISIVDDEIYRSVPTIVISTIDKMANIGTSLGFKSLLGQAKNKCEKHGFVVSGKRCRVPGCQCRMETVDDRKDPIPTLFIQDEMHLVNESLGTFDSHYESFISYYCSSLVPKGQRKKIKYIGATATIQDYKKHIRGLYNKDSKQFPVSVKNENFYSKVDENDICRIIIGAALYGGSITDCIQRMVTIMRLIVAGWLKNADQKIQECRKDGFEGNEDDLKRILQYYLITILYNNSKNDAGILRAILENQGNNMLAGEGEQEFSIAEITGDVEFKTIKNVMHDVEADENKYKTKNVIIATSAISHGVDEDCFNQICFYGMPNQTAEYIQAYSRVGRMYTGIVFDVFRLVRDRDKSYLKNFFNFHHYKERLIDPVPINRYAKNAIYSTLPGIMAGIILQLYNYYYAKDFTKAINNGSVTLDMMISTIKSIYECDSQNSKLYESIIETEVGNMFNAFISNTVADKTVADIIAASNSKHKGPMTNLRDVEAALEVEMKGRN